MSRSRGCVTYLVGLLIFLGGLAGWIEFLFKPLTAAPVLAERGAGGLVADLLRFVPETYGLPLLGYAFLLSSVIIAVLAAILLLWPVRSILRYLESSEAPVSVLESHYTLCMNNLQLTSCTTTRKQRLHANRRNVEAYHYAFSPLEGEIIKDSVSIKSVVNNEEITQRPLIERREGKTLEIIEKFKRRLPTSLFVTYLPDRWVLFFNRLHYFERAIVSRTVISEDRNEYNGEDPMFQVTAVRYPASALTITLDFPKATAPAARDVQSYLISTSAVQEIDVDQGGSGARRIFSAHVKHLKTQQSFRIQWSNTGLKAWKARTKGRNKAKLPTAEARPAAAGEGRGPEEV